MGSSGLALGTGLGEHRNQPLKVVLQDVAEAREDFGLAGFSTPAESLAMSVLLRATSRRPKIKREIGFCATASGVIRGPIIQSPKEKVAV